MKRYVCIHAHCYQPPRENAWLEAIEQQDSAYPHHDWNERVNAECYVRNAASRILDDAGRITRIVNNYSQISFNFGPTLLSWMEHGDPETYRAILEADAASVRRSGHGAALAQAYNHMIMPLANRRDKQTQVVWGIRDFQWRFGRDPAGMWLPETAVDLETLEVLVDHGIAFTILSPAQARRTRPLGRKAWRSVEGANIDPSRAYRQFLPSGRSIDLFFYDGPVSQAVAFERLLDSGERFAERLVEGFSEDRSWPQLMHIATDGESYGHHHRHGEMALSYALAHIEANGLAEITVYGAYLEKHPPTCEVDIIEQSSWSCSHGVGRWMRDCGCQTGGQPAWHQRWRAPLRSALDWLRDELAPGFEEEAGALFEDPWRARDDYLRVILHRSEESAGAFLRAHARGPLTHEDRQRALMLLELQRHAMLMYTSCGWFFSDISGIESTQVLQYAGRAVQLAEKLFGHDLEPELESRLAEAPSNLDEPADGREVYRRFVKPAVVNLVKVAAHYAVSSLFDDYPRESRVYCYDVERLGQRIHRSGRMKLITGRAHVRSRITLSETTLSYAVLHFGDAHVLGGVTEKLGEQTWEHSAERLADLFACAYVPQVVRLFDEHFAQESFSLRSLFRDQQRRVMDSLLVDRLESADDAYDLIYSDSAPLLRLLADINVPVPRALGVAAERAINGRLHRALAKAPPDVGKARETLGEARAIRVRPDEATIGYSLEMQLAQMAARLEEEPDDRQRLRNLGELLDLVPELGFEIDLRRPQDSYWRMLGGPWVEQSAAAKSGDTVAAVWCSEFSELGRKLSIRVEPP